MDGAQRYPSYKLTQEFRRASPHAVSVLVPNPNSAANNSYDLIRATGSNVQVLTTISSSEKLAASSRSLAPTCATEPTVAFPLGAKLNDPYAMYLNDIYTLPSSVAGLPAISVPCGLSEGLPVGLQIIGNFFDEPRVVQAAHAFEQALGWSNRVAAV